MTDATKTRKPLRGGAGLLLVHGIRSIDVAEAAQRSAPWVSMGLSGKIEWTSRLEGALLMASDGDHELVAQVREAAKAARQYRLEEAK